MNQCWTKSLQASGTIACRIPSLDRQSLHRKQSGFLVRRKNSIRLGRFGSTVTSQNFAQQKKKEFQERLKNVPVFSKTSEGTNEATHSYFVFRPRGQEERSLPVSSVKCGHSAAVLVPFCVINGLPSLLFTLRSPNLLHYKGDVSFPGGRKDVKDKDLIETALREAKEELGILKEQVDIWGCMNPVGSLYNDTAVTPIVGFVNLDSTESLTINTDEVQCAFTRSLQSLCDRKNCYSTQYRTKTGFTLPVYLGGDFKIWGLTADILHRTLKLLLPEAYAFELSHIKA